MRRPVEQVELFLDSKIKKTSCQHTLAFQYIWVTTGHNSGNWRRFARGSVVLCVCGSE